MEHEVLLAENGEQAINLFREQDPDLILLDVRMAGMDGYQLVKTLRGIEPGWRPILFLSSYVDAESFAKGIDAGADDYLHKPIDKVILKAKLQAMERLVIMRKQLLDVTSKLAQEKEKIKLIANQDGLTGIANRRFLDQVLKQEFRRHKRTQKTLSLIMIDIDFFKSYNDHYGHLSGDDVLKKCAKKMTALICRAGDLVTRYGGEEFCVVLPDTELDGAKSFAETLRIGIEGLAIERDDLENWKYLTISLGVSSIKPDKDDNAQTLLNAADQALYQAKQLGRNRVCIAKQE
jgi:diguanylate cyclase (GGDEF)-like protein